jgi:hypothetical protein
MGPGVLPCSPLYRMVKAPSGFCVPWVNLDFGHTCTSECAGVREFTMKYLGGGTPFEMTISVEVLTECFEPALPVADPSSFADGGRRWSAW